MQTATLPRAAPRPPRLTLGRAEQDRLAALATAILPRSPEIGETLLAEIERSRIVADDHLPPDVVRMGSAVTFEDGATGRVTEVRLVYPGDADIAAGRISILTPVGVALIGLSAGQSITAAARDGKPRTLKVLAVSPPA